MGNRDPRHSLLRRNRIGNRCLTLPEVSLARRGDAAWLTATVLVQGDEAPVALLERIEARLDELRPARMPMLDPDPVEQGRVAGAAPPEHFESAVARAVERIAGGEVEKVVLAREVRVHMPRPAEPGAVYDALRGAFPSCYCYLAGTPEATFIGASPELLVRREGQRAQTVALAGTRRRSADPSVDRHLAEQLLSSSKDREEQAIVARRIERTLDPVSVWVAAAGISKTCAPSCGAARRCMSRTLSRRSIASGRASLRSTARAKAR